jgi:hypothetical protein
VKLPDAVCPFTVPDELPDMKTKVPGAPEAHVYWRPDDKLTVASALWLVQLNSGLGKETDVSKLPTSFPPPPWNANAPPKEGMNPDASCAK